MEIAGVDGLAWLLAPLSYSENEWLLLGGVTGATLTTFAADSDLRDIIQRNQQSDVYSFALHATDYGDLIWAQVLTAALYLPGWLLEYDDLRVTGRMLGQGLGYGGLFTQALQILLGRERPHAGNGPSSFTGLQFKNLGQAAPSGHTMVAFTIASVLSSRIAEPVVTVILYTAAAAAGFGLVYVDQHWVSDILLGAVIGHAAGMFVVAQEDKRHSSGDQDNSGWRVIPSARGLTFSYRF